MKKDKVEPEDMKKITEAAGLVREDLEKAMASVDWDALPTKITEYVFAGQKGERRQSLADRARAWLGRPGMRPVLAGVGLGLAAGVLGTVFLLRNPGIPGRQAGRYFASPQFLDRVENEMARRETLDYLERSQYVLLDFVQPTGEGEAAGARSAEAGERARDLLTRKKYLNAQLGKGRMATAKAICDQIDLLFLELSQVAEDMTPGELKKIQNMIQESRLLLKINLAKKELQSGV